MDSEDLDNDDNDLPIEQAFVDVHFAEPLPPEFVINELLAVGMNVMSGPPKKAYKSLQSILMGAACAEWTEGALVNLPPWMKVLRPGPSLFVSYEAEAGVINYILEHDARIKTKPGAMYVAHRPFMFQLDEPAQANELLDFMDAKDPVLVVLDPFRNTHSEDENDSGAVVRLLSPLVEWGHKHKAAIVLIHHVNKPSEGKDKSSFYNMRGSSALPGLADGLLTIEDTKDDGNIIINATFKRGQSYRRCIHLGMPGYGWGPNGFEVLPLSVQNVRREWQSGIHDIATIAATLKQKPSEVTAALQDLRRNGECHE